MVAGEGTATPTRPHSSAGHPVTPVVKALARAFRRQRLLETGAYATVQDLARAERINPSYVSRVLRLALLAPKIVEGILDDRIDSPS